MKWQEFVRDYGWRARAEHLAKVLGITERKVRKERSVTPPRARSTALGFLEIFTTWNGRAPNDDEWPAPHKSGAGGYVWYPPELQLLASLVGTMSYGEIAQVLTKRLKDLTGDRRAVRKKNSVALAANRMGLVSTDVLGGITVTEAARQIGTTHVVHAAIKNGLLKARKVGRLWVISHQEWTRWKATIVRAPEGYVQLASLRQQLGIRSDAKLPEFASLGYVPTAIRCNPYGTQVKTTAHGTWYIREDVANQLVADRQAGRPMPWHGKPLPDNLKATYRNWNRRKHPDSCATCRTIWGKRGEPKTFEDYVARYPALQLGEKRHLTMRWDPGLSLSELATSTGTSRSHVARALANGMFVATKVGRANYVSRTEATRWKARKCPAGDSRRSYICLTTAMTAYGFTPAELKREILAGRLKGKLETTGPSKGVAFVNRQQCAMYRESVGYTRAQAAARLGVSVERLRELLEGVDWRAGEGSGNRVPLRTLQALAKRKDSAHGHTMAEAAHAVGRSEQWVRQCIADGVIRVTATKWNPDRIYITTPMLKRLRTAAKNGVKAAPTLDGDWLAPGAAAVEAGVSQVTLNRWVASGNVERQLTGRYWKVHRNALRAYARQFWDTEIHRRPRSVPPAWYRNTSQFEESAPAAKLQLNSRGSRA